MCECNEVVDCVAYPFSVKLVVCPCLFQKLVNVEVLGADIVLYWRVSDRYVILVVFKEASVVLCLVTQTSCVLYVMRETSSLTGKIRKVVSKRYFHKMLFSIFVTAKDCKHFS